MSSSMKENDSEFLQEIGFLCLFFFFFLKARLMQLKEL